jgi:hypothetical protein
VIRQLNDFTLTGIHIFYLDYDIGFQLRRWALKIMSFLISANRLFILTQSTCLHKLIQGKFSVQVLPSPNAAPYCCDLSSETVRVTLEAALAETGYLSADWDQDRESFIVWLLKELKVSEVVRLKPTVHAELAMIMAIANDDIKHVLPYVGVSKVPCIMCSHYIHAFNEVAEQKIATKGSRGKAYPGWSWPSLRDSDRDKELVPAVLKRLRRQLFSDFKEHTEKRRRLSDSSVGPGGPEWEIEPTMDEINELFTATIPEPEE